MMLVQSILFRGTGNVSPEVMVRVDAGRAVIRVNDMQQLTLTIDEIRALHSALGRILEGR